MNANLTYTDQGSGPVLIFLHGAYINGEIWEKQIPYFLSAYRVINIHLPGHNGKLVSIDIPEYSIEFFGDEVMKMLDALKIMKCTAIGLSLGSMIAQNLAARFPDRFEGIVLVGNIVSMRLTIVEQSITQFLFPKWLALRLFGKLNTKQFLKLAFFLTLFMRGNKWLGRKDTRQKIREMISGIQRAEIRRIFAAVHSFRKQALNTGNCPILLITGQYDSPAIHYHAHYLRKKLPSRTTSMIMKGCGHACNYDDPEAFNVLLSNWLVVQNITRNQPPMPEVSVGSIETSCISEYSISP